MKTEKIEWLVRARVLLEKDIPKAERISEEAHVELIVLKKEKDRRIYYQDIVYDLCNQLDEALVKGIVCGTTEEPSDEVQISLKGILKERVALKEENKRLKENRIREKGGENGGSGN